MAVHLSKDEIQYIIDEADRQSTKEIAEWIGCSVQTVCLYKKKYNRGLFRVYRWLPDKLNEIAELRQGGATSREISKHFGCSKAVIDVQLMFMRRKGFSLPSRKDLYRIRKEKKAAL